MRFVRQAAPLAVALVCGAPAACGSDTSNGDAQATTDGGADASTGQLSVIVALPGGVTIAEVDYVISGPTPAQGTAPSGDAQPIDFVVGGLATGTGYSIQLSAGDTAGDECSGGGSFDIAAGTLTGITVQMQCGDAQDAATSGADAPAPFDTGAEAAGDAASSAPDSATGSLSIDGSVTVVPPPPPTACPGIDSFSVIPAALTVGGRASVKVSTIPDDVTPTIVWSASDAAGQTGAGTFADPSAASTTFQCTQVGAVTVAVSVATGPCVGAPFTSMSAVVACDAARSRGRRNLAASTGGIDEAR